MNARQYVSLTPLVLLLLAACGDRNDQPSSDVRIMSYSALASPDEEQSDLPANLELPVRRIVKTADINLLVEHYDSALAHAQRCAGARGGFIAGSELTSRDSGNRSGTVALRVPAAEFENALAELKRAALRVDHEKITGSDVTEELYDVAARLQNKRLAEKRFQEILRVATKAKEILAIEQELASVREDIERLAAHQRFMANQADLSTITMHLREPRADVAGGAGDFTAKIREAFRRGVRG